MSGNNHRDVAGTTMCPWKEKKRMNSPAQERAQTSAKTERIMQALHRASDALVRLFSRYVTGRIIIDVITQSVVKQAWVEMHNTEPDTERMRKTSLTRLAMSTGMDTRVVRKILNEPMRAREEHLSVEAAILSAWAKDPSLRSAETGKPCDIPIFGAWGTFEGFVQRYAGRGVSVRYVLERLIKHGNVKEVGKHFVRLVRSDWHLCVNGEDEALSSIAGSVEKLTHAALHNIEHMASPDKKWLERRRFTYLIPKSNRAQAEDELNRYLIKCWENAGVILRKYENSELCESSNQHDEIGAGFYFWIGGHPTTSNDEHKAEDALKFTPWRNDRTILK